jgi:hypothetical protein
VVAIDPTGVLDVAGSKLFPLGISNPPPLGGKTSDGKDVFQELASGGVNFLRLGRQLWSPVDATLASQVKQVTDVMDVAHPLGILGWVWLGSTPNYAVAANKTLLPKLVAAVKDHPGLGAWKGIDEPNNPKEAPSIRTPAPGMVDAYNAVKRIDPGHPFVVTHEPISPATALLGYRAACDITGADIYPVSYPPGTHAETSNHDISVVGDITSKLKQVAGPKPVWMTLQIAWSGITPSPGKPNIPRFPTALEERFMAYQAIVHGARGLFFFGGNITQVMRPIDARTGWNWTFWQLVLKPLLLELTSPSVQPALLAPESSAKVTASASDIDVATRQTAEFLYVIAVRCGGSTSRVGFTGLPKRHDGQAIGGGEVLFEYQQVPPTSPPDPTKQAFRPIAVSGGGFRDWFGPHDTHVYRFHV